MTCQLASLNFISKLSDCLLCCTKKNLSAAWLTNYFICRSYCKKAYNISAINRGNQWYVNSLIVLKIHTSSSCLYFHTIKGFFTAFTLAPVDVWRFLPRLVLLCAMKTLYYFLMSTGCPIITGVFISHYLKSGPKNAKSQRTGRSRSVLYYRLYPKRSSVFSEICFFTALLSTLLWYVLPIAYCRDRYGRLLQT